jgi:hypothetical protein
VRPFIPVLSRLLLGDYQVDVRVLNSAHWGVPQARQASWSRQQWQCRLAGGSIQLAAAAPHTHTHTDSTLARVPADALLLFHRRHPSSAILPQRAYIFAAKCGLALPLPPTPCYHNTHSPAQLAMSATSDSCVIPLDSWGALWVQSQVSCELHCSQLRAAAGQIACRTGFHT